MKHLKSSNSFFALTALSLIAVCSAVPNSASAASLQSVACPARGQANIELFDQKGTHLGIRLNAFEAINVFQGWGKNEMDVRENNREVRLVRVQVPGQKTLSTQSFLMEKDAVASLPQCEQRRGTKAPMAPAGSAVPQAKSIETIALPPSKTTAKPEAKPQPPEKAKADDKAKPVAKAGANNNSNNGNDDEGDDEGADDNSAPEHQATISTNGAGGLTNMNCCDFPLSTRPKSFLGGMGRFGARRAHGRTHGGADLYGHRGQPILAVANGTVIRAPYFFKKRTLAIDVRHQGGFIVRYGEIDGHSFGLHLNSQIHKKEQIGGMGYVPGAPSPMLHFELYKGTLSGRLSTPGNRFSRRGDITNPTQYLLHWEKNK